MTKSKQKITLFSLILTFLVSIVGLFLVGNVKTFSASADEITNDNFPDTTNWTITSDWQNGDNIFETYLRFYYNQTYTNTAGEEIDSQRLYIGSGHIVQVARVSGRYQLGITATHKEENVEQIVLLPASPNSNKTYIDFYIAAVYAEDYVWEKDLTFYEFSDENIVSERVVAIAAPKDDVTTGGDSGTSSGTTGGSNTDNGTGGGSTNEENSLLPDLNINLEENSGKAAVGIFAGVALLIVGYFIIKNLRTKKGRR